MTTEDPAMGTLTARLASLELQPQILQSGPSGDADPPGWSLDSPEPIMETNGTPGESSGSPPAAWTESREGEETPGRSFDSPQEAGEINLTSLEPIDPVDALGESFGSLSVRRTKTNINHTAQTKKNQKQRRNRQRGGKK